MSDKYCNAGKCECGNLIPPDFCFTPFRKVMIDDMEQCPWPSRQSPVEPPVPPEIENPLDYNSGFHAGQLHAIQRCRAAMHEEFYFRRGPNSEEPCLFASEIIAVIEKVAEEGGK